MFAKTTNRLLIMEVIPHIRQIMRMIPPMKNNGLIFSRIKSPFFS
jgi:hypothetical protein